MNRKAFNSYASLVGFAVFIGGVLALDSRASLLGQLALAVPTFALLFAWTQRLTPDERAATWATVAFSTFIELLCTQCWGLYHYRLGNVPLYVPPGHGLIYVFALSADRTGLFTRHRRALVHATLLTALGWASWGLSRPHADLHGALYLPFFFLYLLRSPRAGIYVATFVVTSYIELLGVHLGTWHWAARMPGLGVTSGDPPSLIAGGYCFFGEIGLWLSTRRTAARPLGAG